MKAFICVVACLTLVEAGGQGYLPKGGPIAHGHGFGNSHAGSSLSGPQTLAISNAATSYGYGAASYGIGGSSAHGSARPSVISHSLIGSSPSGIVGSPYGNGWNTGYSGASQGLSAGLSSGFGAYSHEGGSNIGHRGSSFGSGWNVGQSASSHGVIGSPSYGSGWASGNSGVSQGVIGGSSYGSRLSLGNSGASHGIGASSYGQGYGFDGYSSVIKPGSAHRPSSVLSSVSHAGSSSYPVVSSSSYGHGPKIGSTRILSSSGPFKYNQGHGSSLGGVSGFSGYQYPGNSGGSASNHAPGFGNRHHAGLHQSGSSSHEISSGRYATGSLGGSWASYSPITGLQSSWGKGSW